MGDARDTDLFTIADLVDGAMERIRLGSRNRAGLPTGFVDLDELTGGLYPSQLVLIAGRPAMGKTTLALHFCDRALRSEGSSILYVALSLTAAEVAHRFLACRAGAPPRGIPGGKVFRPIGMEDLERARQELRGAPFRVFAPPAATVPRIAAEARALGRLDLIVVDTFQAIEPENPMERRPDQLDRIGRQLKQLAREAEAPVVVLSQVSRRVDLRPPHRPHLGDVSVPRTVFDETAAVLLLHRPEYFDPNDTPGVAELALVQNALGCIGEVRLSFDRRSSRFDDFRSDTEGWF